MKRFAKGPVTAKSTPALEFFTQVRKKYPIVKGHCPWEFNFSESFLLIDRAQFFHQKPFMGF